VLGDSDMDLGHSLDCLGNPETPPSSRLPFQRGVDATTISRYQCSSIISGTAVSNSLSKELSSINDSVERSNLAKKVSH
jgi:hypothetical protein